MRRLLVLLSVSLVIVSPCPTGQFQCGTEKCVPNDVVCDFKNDCDDGSDEDFCEEQGYGERCSFEQDLCSWESSEWTLQRGQAVWPDHGPPRDHTQNTAAGYYIIPGTQEQTSEILSNTLLPSSNCTVRFYYYTKDEDETSSLSVRLRTGSDDTVLWVRDTPSSFSWQRAEVTYSSSVNSKIVFQYERGDGGPKGLVAVDDISFSKGCLHTTQTTTTTTPQTTPSPQTTPAPSPTFGPCGPFGFLCWRSEGVVCIYSYSHCDYRLDCPLGEDEENCALCDFEEGNCNWTQQTDDDCDWVRGSGSTTDPNTGPVLDHTTNTPSGHYFYLPSSDQPGQRATMVSPWLPGDDGGRCLQLWYYMFGSGSGTLKVYMEDSHLSTIMLRFSQTGDQGNVWRFAQASLPFVGVKRIVVEGVKGSGQVMAFDDVLVTNNRCWRREPGDCDFQTNLCDWTNLGGGDQDDWLRGRGASANPNTGPSVDHTTNSSVGYYLYVDSSVGMLGDRAMLLSDILQPTSREHCVTFWYHMFGPHVGTLNLYRNNRELQASGDDGGILLWTQSGSQGDVWLEGSVTVDTEEPFWFVFVYQKGRGPGRDVALDDIKVRPGPCLSPTLSPPPTPPPPAIDVKLAVGLGVGLPLLLGCVIGVVFYVLRK